MEMLVGIVAAGFLWSTGPHVGTKYERLVHVLLVLTSSTLGALYRDAQPEGWASATVPFAAFVVGISASAGWARLKETPALEDGELS